MISKFKILQRAILLCLVGGAVALSAAADDSWVYFGTYTSGKSKGIYASRLDAKGKLTDLKLVASCVNPSFLATDSKQRFLYAISEIGKPSEKRQGNVLAFKIDRVTGELTKLNEQSSGGDALCHVSVGGSDQVAMVASYGGGSVSSLPIRSDGSLGAPASFIQHRGSSVNPRNQTSPHAHCITPDPTDRFAFTCDLGMDQILAYRIDPKTARLTPNDPALTRVAPGVGPRHIAFHPNRQTAYVINEMDCSITAFSYDGQRGSLKEIQTASTLAGAMNTPALSGAEVVVHPNGKWLYSSTRGIDVISLFAIDPESGKLTHVENVSSGGRTPRNFNINPTGTHLLAANQNSDSIVVFRIDAKSGRLTATGLSLEVDKPSCVLFVAAAGCVPAAP